MNNIKRTLAELFGIEGLPFLQACLMILLTVVVFVVIWFTVFLLMTFANMHGIY